jgi:glutamine synthetase
VLKRQIAAAADLGLRFDAGVEPEVYVLRNVGGRWVPWVAEDGYNAPTRGYDIEATILADAFTEPMVDHMTALGWEVYSFDHEGGDGQYEFEFRHTEALEMADRMVIFRLMAKHVARTLGCIATFMPKPFDHNFGSGAHINMSLADLETGENRFEEPGADASSNGDHGYSRLAYQFTAGVLRHARAITALACPTVNSYKRLVPVGLMDSISWAPVYQAYGHNNRTLMCRLPMNRRCTELRIADSASNFYLVMGLTLAAGLEGIREELDPGDPVNVDTYTVGDEELARRGVHRLPRSLGEALDAFEADELARVTLGPEFHSAFLALKRREWETYSIVISEWEREQYLHLW